MALVTCPNCNGDGKCPMCHGVGKIERVLKVHQAQPGLSTRELAKAANVSQATAARAIRQPAFSLSTELESNDSRPLSTKDKNKAKRANFVLMTLKAIPKDELVDLFNQIRKAYPNY